MTTSSLLRAVVEEHRNPAALEVELHFIDLAPPADVDLRVLQDGVIQGAFQSRFKKAVEVGQFQDPLTFPAKGVQVAFQVDAGLGQGAGLVGAEDIHAPQVLDRGEPLDDHLVGRHAQAPRDRVTETTMGRSSGVSPTASATANRNDSSQGR